MSLVRQFSSLEEIRAVVGFVDDNPVGEHDFSGFVGYYRLKDSLSCCVRDGIGLCRQRHQFGFVVRLKDETASIVGNECASTKFGANEHYRSSRQEMEKKLALRSKLAGLENVLQNREKSESLMAQAETALQRIEEFKDELERMLGPLIVKALSSMAKNSDGRVLARTITTRFQKDKDGKIVDREDNVEDVVVGRLPSLSSLDAQRLRDLSDRLVAAKRAFSRIDTIGRRPIAKEITYLSSTISRIEPTSGEIANMSAQIKSFLASDLGLLSFLSRNHKDRVQAVIYAHAKNGQKISKAAAETWLEQLTEATRKRLGVSAVRPV